MLISGIYIIKNLINEKFYIGSSKDILERFKDHIRELNKDNHANVYLQAAWYLYGEKVFEFLILEECEEEYLLIREQYYLDNNNWNQLYNLSKIACAGGSEAVEIPVYLLNLKGDIIKEYKSGSDLARDLNIKPSHLPYSEFNTKSVFRRKYRIVSQKFYNKNKDIILSWRSYTSETEYKKKLNKIPKYKVYKKEEEYLFFSFSEIGKFLNISREMARITMLKKVKIHKKTGCYIDYNEEYLNFVKTK